MMSLQEIALCYICMMLAIPTIIYLLMTLKGTKVKEVKIQEQKQSFPTPTPLHWADHYEPCDGYWSDQYEKMIWRQAAQEAGCSVKQLCHCGYSAKNLSLGDGTRCTDCHKRHKEYLATRNAILALEEAEVKINWDEYADDDDEPKMSFDKKHRNALLRKPWRERKVSVGKDLRDKNGRRHKYQWGRAK